MNRRFEICPNSHTGVPLGLKAQLDADFCKPDHEEVNAPRYKVFGRDHDSNTPSVVYPGSGDHLVVLISGTGASPSDSELFLSAVNDEHNFPVIGLSYCFAPQTDVQRNELILKHTERLCDTPDQINKQAQGLLQNHHDLVNWGEGPETEIEGLDLGTRSPTQALVHRLESLLLYLHDNRSEEEGWSKFIDTSMGNSRLAFEKFIMVGYSQGAGHLLSMARTRYHFRGLVLISGTQEIVLEDADDPWMSWTPGEEYKSPNIVAFKHAREEGGQLMDRNWACIPSLGLKRGVAKEELVEVAGSRTAASMHVTRLTGSNGGRSFHVHEEPSPNKPASRPYHCSMLIDAYTPDAPGLNPPKLYYHTLFPFMIRAVLSYPADRPLRGDLGESEREEEGPEPASKL